MSVNFIPQNVEKFYSFLERIVSYVYLKRAEDDKWNSVILQERYEEIAEAQTRLGIAIENANRNPTSALVAERRRVRREVESVLRGFIRQYLHFPPVTDLDRDILGIPNLDTIPTAHIDVHELVEFELVVRSIREVRVRFWVKGADNRAKPRGYDGAVLVWGLTEEPPVEPEYLANHTMASRTPHILHFKEADRGKRVYIALKWQNERGNTGAWSELQWAIVP